MKVFISSLIKGFSQMEEIAYWIDGKNDENLGVELIAFTHDQSYWDRLTRLLTKLTCPLTFHGPYIEVEATSEKGTVEYDHLLESYKKVCSLAARYHVEHVVFHYTQKGVKEKEKQRIQQIAMENIRTILDIGKREGAEILVENLCYPPSGQLLFTSGEYQNLYRQIPNLNGIIDMGHASLTGLNMKQMLETDGSRIHAYHFHNNDGTKDSHNSIRDGKIDYITFSELFKKYTPEARIVLEYEPHAWESEASLERDIEFVRAWYSA